MESRSRGVYAISVAADLVRMQVQNLRVYERRELLAEGLNLAGIAKVLDLEAEVSRLRARLAKRDAPGR
jgi:DNA-binding transcriptional MerR regulator